LGGAGEATASWGLRGSAIDLWVRLYPINYRYLDDRAKFSKYDIIKVDARPSRNDPRQESWRPNMESLVRLDHLPAWARRRAFVEPQLDPSMCGLLAAVRATLPAKSLGLIRPMQPLDMDVVPHGGWTEDERRKIAAYVNQLDMLGSDRTPLQAPRFKVRYRYRCAAADCRGHAQGLLDWELVAFQRRIGEYPDEELAQAIRTRFLDQVCAPDRNVLFYVGNQAKRQQTFSVLGVYWPPRQ
jgi:hypothetical protein